MLIENDTQTVKIHANAEGCLGRVSICKTPESCLFQFLYNESSYLLSFQLAIFNSISKMDSSVKPRYRCFTGRLTKRVEATGWNLEDDLSVISVFESITQEVR